MNQNICRCCLKEDLTQTFKIFDDNGNLFEDLQLYLPALLKCVNNDGLPQIICDICWLQVQQIKSFHQQCCIADQELRTRYADYKNQAVEEVLGLIEKLRQEDNNKDLSGENQDQQIIHEFEYNFEFSQLSSDFDLYNSSHDSGIFEEEFYTLDSQNFSSLIRNEENEISISELSPTSVQSNESETSKRKKSYKGPFFCNHCDKKFTRNFQLKLHLISVHQIGDGLQYNCQLCTKTFASNHSLSYHQKSVHYQEKPHICQQCNRQFVLKSQLASHMRTHTGEMKPRIFDCQECGKKWPTKSDLKTHMRSHDPNMERPFKCDRCEKSFFTRGHLTSHQLVHTGEKPFVCDFCKRSYQCIGNLNNHLSRRHIKEMSQREKMSCGDYSSQITRTQGEFVLMEA